MKAKATITYDESADDYTLDLDCAGSRVVRYRRKYIGRVVYLMLDHLLAHMCATVDIDLGIAGKKRSGLVVTVAVEQLKSNPVLLQSAIVKYMEDVTMGRHE